METFEDLIMAVDISQYVAQFGRNSGAPIAAGISRGIERGNRNRLVEQARQDEMQERNRMAQAQKLQAQEEYMTRGTEVLQSLPPEQRPEGWRSLMRGAAEQGWDITGDEEWDERMLPRLQARFGVATPKQEDSNHRRIVGGADGYQYYADTGDRVLPNVQKPAEGESGGPFKGAGLEQQMLNTVLDPNIPWSDPRKQFARQRLERETTLVTPEGTFTRPGYDLTTILPGDTQQPAAIDGATQPSPSPRGQFFEKPSTEGERASAGFYGRMVNAESELSNIASNYPEFKPESTIEAVRGATNYTASPEFQQYRQAASDWIRAKLRKESGAVIGDEEMRREYETYFPIPGDSREVIAQKARARTQATDGMRAQAGRAAASTARQAPQTAIDFLRQNPHLKEQFQAKYGYLPEGI